MVHQNKNIKTKNTKNNLLPYFTPNISNNLLSYFTPNVSNIHVLPKSWLHWSLHTNNVWEDRTSGSPQNSAKTALCQCRLCSVVSPKTTQTHICITNNLLYFTTSLTIYFTLLHSLKTRLFINPVLSDPVPINLTLVQGL